MQVNQYVAVGFFFQQVASVTGEVPANGAKHPTSFALNYTFTSNDALVGKVVFKAEAVVFTGRDPFQGATRPCRQR